MTNKEVVRDLTSLGYKIDFNTRTDGSIRVRKIVSPSGNVVFHYKPQKGKVIKDSKGKAKKDKEGKVQREKAPKSNPSAGNNKARELLNKETGKDTSHDMAADFQRKEARKVADKVNAQRRTKDGVATLTEAEKKAIRKAQRQARKAGKKGHISRKQYREYKKQFGAKRAAEAMNNTLLHLQGWSYPAQIAWFITHVQTTFSGQLGVSSMCRFLQPYAHGSKLFRDDDLTSLQGIWSGTGTKAQNFITDQKERWTKTKEILQKYGY